MLGEAPGEGVVYRQKEVVAGESSFIRERARALGMSMAELAGRVGVTSGYMTSVSRGRQEDEHQGPGKGRSCPWKRKVAVAPARESVCRPTSSSGAGWTPTRSARTRRPGRPGLVRLISPT